MRNVISNVQDFLSFKHCNGPSFSSNVGLGRVAVLAALLSVIFGIHITLMVSLLLRSSHDSKNENLSSILVIQWCLNVCFIVVFHLSEFFVTAIYNPSVVSAESFMVDHSKAYTVAMVTSWVEFWIEYAFVKFLEIDQIIVMPVYMRWIGLVFVMTGQVLRTAAMATCGPSFNHLIQKEKKPNHVLITHGVYSVFRHPSYVGKSSIFFSFKFCSTRQIGHQIIIHRLVLLEYRNTANAS